MITGHQARRFYSHVFDFFPLLDVLRHFIDPETREKTKSIHIILAPKKDGKKERKKHEKDMPQ